MTDKEFLEYLIATYNECDEWFISIIDEYKEFDVKELFRIFNQHNTCICEFREIIIRELRTRVIDKEDKLQILLEIPEVFDEFDE